MCEGRSGGVSERRPSRGSWCGLSAFTVLNEELESVEKLTGILAPRKRLCEPAPYAMLER